MSTLLSTQYQNILLHGGVIYSKAMNYVSISEKDRYSFLDAFLTKNIACMQENQRAEALLLNVRGKIQYYMDIYCLKTKFILCLESPLGEELSLFLNKRKFISQVQIKDHNQDYCSLGVYGPKSTALICQLFNLSKENLQISEECILVKESNQSMDYIIAKKNPFGMPGYHVILCKEHQEKIKHHIDNQLNKFQLPEINPILYDTLQIKYGIPNFKRDLMGVLATETNLDNTIDSMKGCYLGQEVITRIRSRGKIRRQLMSFYFKLTLKNLPTPDNLKEEWRNLDIYLNFITPGTVIKDNHNQVIGKISSSVLIKKQLLLFCIAYIQKKEESTLLIVEHKNIQYIAPITHINTVATVE